MKKAKKILTLVACAVLLVCISVGATIAYMTSITDPVTNTFTVGDIEITLDEANTNLYGVETTGRGYGNEYKLVPDHTYVKDPTVHVTDKGEPCYVFVKVNNGFNGVEGLEAPAVEGEYTQIDEQITRNGWTKLDTDEDETENVYYKKLEASTEYTDGTIKGCDLVVFEEFKIAHDFDVTDEEFDYDSLEIIIKAYAIQSDGFTGTTAVSDAWAAVQDAETTNQTQETPDQGEDEPVNP